MTHGSSHSKIRRMEVRFALPFLNGQFADAVPRIMEHNKRMYDTILLIYAMSTSIVYPTAALRTVTRDNVIHPLLTWWLGRSGYQLSNDPCIPRDVPIDTSTPQPPYDKLDGVYQIYAFEWDIPTSNTMERKLIWSTFINQFISQVYDHSCYGSDGEMCALFERCDYDAIKPHLEHLRRWIEEQGGRMTVHEDTVKPTTHIHVQLSRCAQTKSTKRI